MAATWSDFDRVHPGGESSRNAQRRGLALIRLLAHRHPSETVALATHGNLLALVLNTFDPPVGFDFWKSLAFPDVFELRLLPSGAGVFSRIEARAAEERRAAPVDRDSRSSYPAPSSVMAVESADNRRPPRRPMTPTKATKAS